MRRLLRLRRRLEEMSCLLEVTRRIGEGLHLEEILNHVFVTFQALVPYDRLGLALLEPDGQTLKARYARSTRPVHLPLGYTSRLKGSSLAPLLATEHARIINDLEAHLRANPDSDSTRLLLNEGMRSSLTCPLVAAGKRLGFLFFSSQRPGTYADAHIELYRQISVQLALAVERAQLYEALLEARNQADRLLHNVLPSSVADRLLLGGEPIAEAHPAVTVLFADLVGFTRRAAVLSPARTVALLNGLFSVFDMLAEAHGVEKIKTVGDAYVAAAGLPLPRPDHAIAVARLALDMRDAAARYPSPDGQPLAMRFGIHTGPVVAGVIGQRRFAYDLWGDTVNVASRLESHGLASCIQVSEETAACLQDRFRLTHRGPVLLKGRGEIEVYFLEEELGGELGNEA